MPGTCFFRFRRSHCAALLAGGSLLLGPAAAAGQHLAVRHPTCAAQAQPLGVQQAAPALSWEVSSDQRNVVQTAYRILVSDSQKALDQHVGTSWDSGKITARTSRQIPYAGRPLQAATTYYWQVQIFDNQGNTSAWSAPAQWQMGLLAPTDWHGARWIAYDQLPAARVSVLPVDGAKRHLPRQQHAAAAA